MTGNWEPPYTFEEKLKYALIPPRLYIRQLAARAMKSGEPELRLLPDLVDRQKIAVDVGANKGIYTYFLARIAKRVEAFEPNPKIYRILARGLPANAVAHRVALTDRPGTARLLVPARKANYSNQGATLSETKFERVDGGGAHGVVEVEARTLDSYGFTNLGFIKIDVEGHEASVLDGAAETIARERPAMLIEMEERHTGEPIEEQLTTVLAMGYDGFFENKGRLTPLNAIGADGDRRVASDGPRYGNNFIFLPRGKD